MAITLKLETQIRAALDSDRFLSADFSLRTEQKGSYSHIEIVYLFGKGFFACTVPDRASVKKTAYGEDSYYDISITVSPGNLTERESVKAQSGEALISEIDSWLQRLREEIDRGPQARHVKTLEEHISALYQKMGFPEDDEQPLDGEKSASLIDRLGELEKTLAENIEKSESNKSETRRKLDELHAQVAHLTRMIQEKQPRKNVLRALFSRITAWGSKPENAQLLLDAGVKVAHMLQDGKSKG